MSPGTNLVSKMWRLCVRAPESRIVVCAGGNSPSYPAGFRGSDKGWDVG